MSDWRDHGAPGGLRTVRAVGAPGEHFADEEYWLRRGEPRKTRRPRKDAESAARTVLRAHGNFTETVPIPPRPIHAERQGYGLNFAR